MPRGPRVDVGGWTYHVLNRANRRSTILKTDADFAAFEHVLAQGLEREPGLRLLAYCLMPNHWHLVVRTTRDGDLGRFMKWITGTHTARWHAHRHEEGSGHLYQGRYKSFLVEEEKYLYVVCRYVERNAMRAGLVNGRAGTEAWRWGSLWRWLHPEVEADVPVLSDWPTNDAGRGGRPRNWVDRVNRPETQEELDALRASVQRARPLGPADWVERTVRQFGLESTLRMRGRPVKVDGSQNKGV